MNRVYAGKMYMDPVTESVSAFGPATVANLGPGFDWLGCAIDVRFVLISLVICLINYIFMIQTYIYLTGCDCWLYRGKGTS